MSTVDVKKKSERLDLGALSGDGVEIQKSLLGGSNFSFRKLFSELLLASLTNHLSNVLDGEDLTLDDVLRTTEASFSLADVLGSTEGFAGLLMAGQGGSVLGVLLVSHRSGAVFLGRFLSLLLLRDVSADIGGLEFGGGDKTRILEALRMEEDGRRALRFVHGCGRGLLLVSDSACVQANLLKDWGESGMFAEVGFDGSSSYSLAGEDILTLKDSDDRFLAIMNGV